MPDDLHGEASVSVDGEAGRVELSEAPPRILGQALLNVTTRGVCARKYATPNEPRG